MRGFSVLYLLLALEVAVFPKLFSTSAGSGSAAARLIALDAGDADALEEVLYADIIANLYAIDFYEQVGLPPAGSVGERLPVGYSGFIGVLRPNLVPGSPVKARGLYLSSLMLLGNNTVPIFTHPGDYRVLGRCIHRSRRRIDSLFGPSALVNSLWRRLKSRMPTPASYRPVQPLLYLRPETDMGHHISAPLPRIPDSLAPLATTDIYDQQVGQYAYFSTAADYEALIPAAAAMFREEVGIDPLRRYGAGYRSRVRTLSVQQRTVIAKNTAGDVIFKADAGLASLDIAQIQGLWLHPDYRGLGLGAPLTAAACELLRRRYRHLSLYVNDYNTRARALYARLGWGQIGEYSTVIFAR